MSRIILADDDPVIGQLASDALLQAGHAVGWVADGIQALKVMRARPPSLAIIDCGMPVMSGVQLVRAMRGDGRLCGIPVLMLTARQSDIDEHLALTAGAQDYLRKPVDLDLLVGRVEALLFQAAKMKAVG